MSVEMSGQDFRNFWVPGRLFQELQCVLPRSITLELNTVSESCKGLFVILFVIARLARRPYGLGDFIDAPLRKSGVRGGFQLLVE